MDGVAYGRGVGFSLLEDPVANRTLWLSLEAEACFDVGVVTLAVKSEGVEFEHNEDAAPACALGYEKVAEVAFERFGDYGIDH